MRAKSAAQDILEATTCRKRDKSDSARWLLLDRRRPDEGEPWEIDGELEEDKDLSGIACGPDGHGLIVTDEGSLVQPFRLEREERKLSAVGRRWRSAAARGRGGGPGRAVLRRRLVLRYRFARDRPQESRPPAVAPSRLPTVVRADGELPAVEISHALEPLLESDGLLAGTTSSGSTRRAGHRYRGHRRPRRPRCCSACAARPWTARRSCSRSRIDGPVRARPRPAAAARAVCPGAWRGVGIRDLAAVPDGVLVLSGPSTDDDAAPFALWLWGGRSQARRLWPASRTWARPRPRGCWSWRVGRRSSSCSSCSTA